MYTIKKFVNDTGSVSELYKASEWSEAQAKAAALQIEGFRVEIFDNQGDKISFTQKRPYLHSAL